MLPSSSSVAPKKSLAVKIATTLGILGLFIAFIVFIGFYMTAVNSNSYFKIGRGSLVSGLTETLTT